MLTRVHPTAGAVVPPQGDIVSPDNTYNSWRNTQLVTAHFLLETLKSVGRGRDIEVRALLGLR